MQVADFKTPLGVALRVTASRDALVGAEFVAPSQRTSGRPSSDSVLSAAAAEVRAYFARRLRRFSVPLAFEGTEFQRDVWRLVASLEFGDVVSYGEVARAIGHPLSHRGVAAAMRSTPIDLFIAAHRVIGSDGRVRGCGPGSIRARLLNFERSKLVRTA